MKKKRTTYFGMVLCVLSFTLTAQNKDTSNASQLIIGEWAFVKALDLNNKEVKYITKDFKGPDGKDIQIPATAPDLTINDDYTYTKTYTNGSTDNGHWKLLSRNLIEYEMIVPKYSDEETVAKLKQELYGKKAKTNTEGHFLDTTTEVIIVLTATDLLVDFEGRYVFVYRKK